jgi:hypothetical protein
LTRAKAAVETQAAANPKAANLSVAIPRLIMLVSCSEVERAGHSLSNG